MNAPKKIWVLVEPSGQLIAGYTDYRSKIKYIRADIVEEMREALSLAASTFRFYEGHHDAKGAQAKAQMNRELADQMEAALDRLEGE